MTPGTDDQQLPSTPALTRRELRERERSTETNQPVPGPSGQALEPNDGIRALFGAPTGGSTFVPSPPAEPASPFAFTPTSPTAKPSTAAPASFTRVLKGEPIATRQSTSVRPKRIARTVGSRLLSLGAMVFAGALAFGMSVPANAFYSPSTAMAAEDSQVAAPKALQFVEVANNVELTPATRDAWSVTSWADMLRQRYGTRSFNYTVGNGSIRWPFPSAVPISSGFGDRVSPCRGCSVHHMGIDLTPGFGAAIFAIADGVVIEHQESSSGFGNYVILEHHINGHTVTTLYAHMQFGSSPLVVGEVVKVGDFVGLVGQTGMATGPHLHLEITVDGLHVDPFTWLKTNAN